MTQKLTKLTRIIQDNSIGVCEGEKLRSAVGFHVKCTSETDVAVKVCQRCRHERPIFMFGNGRGRRGIFCQGCFDVAKTERLRRRREARRLLIVTKSAPIGVRRRAQLMWGRARLNAWRKGMAFEITQQWIIAKIQAGHCEATGLPFDLNGSTNGLRSNFAPSLDRRDSNEGYTEDNCQVVVWIYNCAKGAGTHEDVVRMSIALARQAAEQEGRETGEKAA